MRGNGGFWNRAGRRSGGARPTPIYLTRDDGLRLRCPDCGNEDAPALITRGCAGCETIHAAWLDGLLPALIAALAPSSATPSTETGTDD